MLNTSKPMLHNILLMGRPTYVSSKGMRNQMFNEMLKTPRENKRSIQNKTLCSSRQSRSMLNPKPTKQGFHGNRVLGLRERNPPALPELRLALYPHFVDLLHSLERLLHHFPVIPFRPVPSPLKLKRGILRQLLAMELPISLGPLDLTGITFHLKILVAFRPAKPKYLHTSPQSTNAKTSPHQ
jgi:hypothetical protein